MIDLVKSRHADIGDICRRRRVQSLAIFGSATSGNWDDVKSDLDFLVQFEPLGPGQLFDNFFDLKFDLQALFGRRIDLVLQSGIRDPQFLAAVNRSRQVLYAA